MKALVAVLFWTLRYSMGDLLEETEPKNDPYLFDLSSSNELEYGPLEDLTIMHFLLDFARWAEWDSIVMFVPDSSVMLRTLSFYSYMNRNGIFTSLHSTARGYLPQSVFHKKHRLGIGVICENKNDSFMKEVSDLGLFDPYRFWVFIVRENVETNYTERLSTLSFGVDSNVMLSKVERPEQKPPRNSKLTTPGPSEETSNFVQMDPTCRVEHNKNYCANETFLPHRLKRQIAGDAAVIISIDQMYKVVKADNGTLISRNLGFWDTANGLANLDKAFDIEERIGLPGYKLTIGVKNSTLDSVGSLSHSTSGIFAAEEELDEDAHMLELLNCLLYGMNATYEFIQQSKLGWRNEEGGWTHLLGAVVDGSVDFALDTLDVAVDKTQDLYLSLPIVRSMNNIYFRRPEADGMRDIFLEPFSPRLILCVVSTALLLSVAMILITISHYQIFRSKRNALTIVTTKKSRKERSISLKQAGNERKWEISEAALWSVSVICMQGSPWSPNSKSGSLLLILSLLFGLIIYNSYAAFITSVLSVTNVKIKGLEDLITNNFAFGYTLGTSDDEFLRTVNDSLLRELYFRGLVQNKGVNDILDGMDLATQGGYAFFVSARIARRALRTVVPHDLRCDVQELSLPITRTVAAIPFSRKSPYKKILNYKVLRMIESGILHRFQELILPSMPLCVERSKFNSAQLSDVYSAFMVLALGWISAVFVLIIEILWFKRKAIRRKIFNTEININRKFDYDYSPYWTK